MLYKCVYSLSTHINMNHKHSYRINFIAVTIKHCLMIHIVRFYVTTIDYIAK